MPSFVLEMVWVRSCIAIAPGRNKVFLPFTRRRRTAWLNHLADELSAYFGGGLVLGEGDVGQLGRVADEARIRVARYVGPPFPRGRVRVSRSDVLGLQALKLLLRS